MEIFVFNFAFFQNDKKVFGMDRAEREASQ
jgi:hypothetical protein